MTRFSPLLAFSFLNPWLLGGLLFALIPLAIHLWSRPRYVETPWAAMRFLQAALQRQSRRLRYEKWLLLATRMLLLVIAALALAGPTFERANWSSWQASPRLRILVVDTSQSMGYIQSGESRFAQAGVMAQQILETGREGDAWLLACLSRTQPFVLIQEPAYQASQVAHELEQLALVNEQADVATLLDHLLILCDRHKTFEQREIHFLTDLQQANWQPEDPAVAQRIQQAFHRLSRMAMMKWHLVGETQAENLAVTNLMVTPAVCLAHQPVQIVATVQRFATGNLSPSEEIAELLLNGQILQRQPVKLAANSAASHSLGEIVQTGSVKFSVVLSPGDQRLEVRCGSDALSVDNSRRVVVPVRDKIPILLVNGRRSLEPMGRATDFVELALNPTAEVRSPDNSPEASPFRTTTIESSELLRTDLAAFDTVFLCNVAQLTEREIQVLRNYAQAGGAVVFSLGSRTQLGAYQALLNGGTPPLMPVEFLAQQGQPAKPTQFFEFDLADGSHPIVEAFRGNPNAGFQATKTFAYVQTRIPTESPARTALAFTNGDPAILSSPVGRGVCLLVTTSLDPEWGTWPIWGHSFVPMMRELAFYALRHSSEPKQGLVGSQWVIHPREQVASSPQLIMPDLSRGEMTRTSLEGGGEFATNSLEQVGFYEVRWPNQVLPSEFSAINPDSGESNLAMLPEKELETWKDPTAIQEIVPKSAGREPITTASDENKFFWVRMLLGGVFLLLLIEPFLALRR